MTEFLIYRFSRGRTPEYVGSRGRAQAALSYVDLLNGRVAEGDHDPGEGVRYGVFLFHEGRFQPVKRPELPPEH